MRVFGQDALLSGKGRLQIDTVADDIGTPVPNATVRITPRQDSGNVIEEMMTDDSGQTPTMDLPAPPVDLSLEPSGEQPYSEYDVTVEMDGFESRVVEGVQILPNTGSYLNVALTRQAAVGGETIVIRKHTLWGADPAKIPEDPTKPLPPSTGFVVLPEPVIPEFVVVHAGVPTNASAPDYWVPFKEYIKNVASSEIYATWPDATIRANVYAIISFTLNRIYTEWYRGNGYSFTITNSTAYDHAFVYGRNIFDEISKVVDEIFNMFITRPNIRQPLLAQYCDGRKSSCPNWMTFL